MLRENLALANSEIVMKKYGYNIYYMKVLIEIIIGFIVADIFTGTIHWLEDTYLSYCINFPILSSISKDNEMHHYFPRSILAYSYLDHLTLSLPFVIMMLLLFFFINKCFLYKHIFFFISFFTFTALSNIIHRLSHMRDCEKSDFIKNIQTTGILCSQEHHNKHHIRNLEKYCVISEYNNYFLDNMNFWRLLEYIIYVITGIKPNRKQSYNEYKDIHTNIHLNSKLKCPDTPTINDVNKLKKILHEYKMKNC